MDSRFDFDTICAVATPIGQGGIGIIRISGAGALAAARSLFHPSRKSCTLHSHQLHHGWICEPSSGEPIDEVLLSYMASPHSYTREDVVEINCHGGYMALNRILELVLREGARLAEPGEFTRRAFLKGRIDLSQAEAVADLIHSQSQESLAAASRLLKGDFRQEIESWREHILQIEAHIEASLDFSEDCDSDTPTTLQSSSHTLEHTLIPPIAELLERYGSGRILREGLTIALMGKPNVGKSSLLNALLGRERAIVTSVAGTTRDVIEDSFLVSGVLVRLLDTAGLRSRADPIETIGIEHALRCAQTADVVLWLIDRSRALSEEDDLVFDQIRTSQRMILLNKADLAPALTAAEVQSRYGVDTPLLEISALDKQDIDRLRGCIHEMYIRQPLETCHSTIIPNLRHKECLELALRALERARDLISAEGVMELISFELQSARRHIDSILGWSAEEDLLDRIFSQFCIGK